MNLLKKRRKQFTTLSEILKLLVKDSEYSIWERCLSCMKFME